MPIESMNDLFLHTLEDIYFAENQIIKALPKMSAAATSTDLAAAFDSHLAETEIHVDRLKQVFEQLGEKPTGEECPAIEGIIEEAEDLIEEIQDENTLDAALIAAAQAVEHYEITRYGTLVAWAGELGLDDIAELLTETLDEEHAADIKLTDLGESRINAAAVASADV
jgi:ferritin-like metal-binding protein YciE